MTLREFVKLMYLGDNQTVKIYDYDLDENGENDIMLPLMYYGEYTSRQVHEVEYFDLNFLRYVNYYVRMFSSHGNCIYIYINKGE